MSQHLLYRRLTSALRFFIVAHVAALLTMALLLEPGLRPTITVAERAAYVATHPWLWQLGWLPWQLCALSNLLLSWSLIVWLRARPRRAGWMWAALSFVFTIAAVIPEQWAELVLVTDYIASAQAAGTAAGLQQFAEKERWVFIMTGPCANTSYVAMTLAWVVALTRAAGPNVAPSSLGRAMTWLGAAMCVPFAGASLVIYRATRTLELTGMEQSIPLNAIAFPALVVWSLLVAIVLRRLHHEDHPRADATLHALRPAWLAWLCDLRDQLRPVPTFELKSEIRNVVYLNWMVPTERARRLLPPELELECFGEHTALSVLTYTHGHFGPSAAGPLRKLLPSPHQSNWRLYLKPRGGIYFIKSVLSSRLYTIGSRLMADGLPAHHAGVFKHARSGRNVVSRIEPGNGNAPDLNASVEVNETRALPEGWRAHFDDWDAAVHYLVEQNCAMAPLPALGAVFASHIDIPILVQDVEPAQGDVTSTWLADLVEGCEVFCFVVPAVSFRALGEEATAPLVTTRERA